MPSPLLARSSWRWISPRCFSMPTANASMPRSGTRPLRSDSKTCSTSLLRQCAHPLPSRTYRFTPADDVDAHAERGLLRMRLELERRSAGAPRGPPSIAAASSSVTVPCAARCSKTCRTPALGELLEPARALGSGLAAGAGGGADGRRVARDREASVRHARHDVRLGARMVELDAAHARPAARRAGRRARTARRRSRRPRRPRSAPCRASGTARPARPSASGTRSASSISCGLPKSSDRCATDVDRGLDAVHARHALAGLGADAVLHACSRRPRCGAPRSAPG